MKGEPVAHRHADTPVGQGGDDHRYGGVLEPPQRAVGRDLNAIGKLEDWPQAAAIARPVPRHAASSVYRPAIQCGNTNIAGRYRLRYQRGSDADETGIAHAIGIAAPTARPTRTVVAMATPKGSMKVTEATLIAIW